MVWIAGGGYFSGSGGQSLYGPQYLLDKDIVLVTMNYRIGILGKLFIIYYNYNCIINIFGNKNVRIFKYRKR